MFAEGGGHSKVSFIFTLVAMSVVLGVSKGNTSTNPTKDNDFGRENQEDWEKRTALKAVSRGKRFMIDISERKDEKCIIIEEDTVRLNDLLKESTAKINNGTQGTLLKPCTSILTSIENHVRYMTEQAKVVQEIESDAEIYNMIKSLHEFDRRRFIDVTEIMKRNIEQEDDIQINRNTFEMIFVQIDKFQETLTKLTCSINKEQKRKESINLCSRLIKKGKYKEALREFNNLKNEEMIMDIINESYTGDWENVLRILKFIEVLPNKFQLVSRERVYHLIKEDDPIKMNIIILLDELNKKTGYSSLSKQLENDVYTDCQALLYWLSNNWRKLTIQIKDFFEFNAGEYRKFLSSLIKDILRHKNVKEVKDFMNVFPEYISIICENVSKGRSSAIKDGDLDFFWINVYEQLYYSCSKYLI